MEKHLNCPRETHVHEVQGSVRIAGREPHNHRFATVSCEPVDLGNGRHAHQVTFRTDSYEGHYHEFTGRTDGGRELGDRHVHCLEGTTTECANHRHCFRVATLIEDPIGD